jgi:hypothetical protein
MHELRFISHPITAVEFGFLTLWKYYFFFFNKRNISSSYPPYYRLGPGRQHRHILIRLLPENVVNDLMVYIFHAVHYYANLLIKPTSQQSHLYTRQHVSAATIRPSSRRMFFLGKAAYGTLVR